MICYKCKKIIDCDSAFCKYCGAKCEKNEKDIETNSEKIGKTLRSVVFSIEDSLDVKISKETKKDIENLIKKYGEEVLEKSKYTAIDAIKKDKKDNPELYEEDGMLEYMIVKILTYKTIGRIENKSLPFMKKVWEIFNVLYEPDEEGVYKGDIVRCLKSILGYYYESDEYISVFEKIKKKAEKCCEEEVLKDFYFKDYLYDFATKNKINII